MHLVNRLIMSAYDGIEDLDCWREALHLLATATGSRAAGVFAVDRASGSLIAELSSGMPDGFMRAYGSDVAPTDPRVPAAIAGGPLHLLDDSQPTLRQRMQHSGVVDFLRHWDLPYTVSSLLDVRSDGAWALYLSRSASQGTPSVQAKTLLECCAPHYVRALRFRRRWLGLDPDRLDGPWPNSTPKLSARQREVLRLVAEGLHDKQIATTLGLSVNTVNNHIRSILQQLGARSRQHAVWLARQHGWRV